jgi:hypothetical protein
MPRWSGPAVTGTENGIDFDATYTVAGMRGVAFWLHGWDMEEVPESWELDCDDPAHVLDYDEDDEDNPERHDAPCYLYNEPELVPVFSRVRAVMVGDDAEHIVDTDDLTEIGDDDYCAGCGQTGCYADGRAS